MNQTVEMILYLNPLRVKMKLRFLKILMAETFFKVILQVLGIDFGQNQKH